MSTHVDRKVASLAFEWDGCHTTDIAKVSIFCNIPGIITDAAKVPVFCNIPGILFNVVHLSGCAMRKTIQVNSCPHLGLRVQ